MRCLTGSQWSDISIETLHARYAFYERSTDQPQGKCSNQSEIKHENRQKVRSHLWDTDGWHRELYGCHLAVCHAIPFSQSGSLSVVSFPVSRYVQRTDFQTPLLILSTLFTSVERQFKLNIPKPFASFENHHLGICVHFSSPEFANFPTHWRWKAFCKRTTMNMSSTPSSRFRSTITLITFSNAFLFGHLFYLSLIHIWRCRER